jgi:bifunctional non-homologous end joining protein LigD
VPLARYAGWDEVKTFAKAISQFMARQIPERFSAKMGPKNRVGKIFVDYLRNQRGASTVAAYSVRARPGLPVSVPIRRDELDNLRSAAQWLSATCSTASATCAKTPGRTTATANASPGRCGKSLVVRMCR